MALSMVASFPMGFGSAVDPSSGDTGCLPPNYCLVVNPFAGESGLYQMAGIIGVSPTIEVKIGDTITFDQGDASNWYHPIGIAYEPDGAHGSTWGGAELPEVEGKGELQYFIDGKKPTCADAGDTGLDCYEPEFFVPRGDWTKKTYKAQLTVTQAVADKSHGGVLYYFCHIHSKMSGKIVIKKADGSAFVPPISGGGPTERALYSPVAHLPFDAACGTTGAAPFAPGGTEACSEAYLSGKIDTDFEACLQAIDCQMNKQMRVLGYDTHASQLATFMQQMIPHHLNAVNMAKVLMKHVSTADITAAMDEDGLTDILWSILNVQNYQVHQFRNYLGGSAAYKAAKDDKGAALTATSLGEHCTPTIAERDYPAIWKTETFGQTEGKHVAGCVPSATKICVTLDEFAGESGYYKFAGHAGVSPTFEVNIGDTIEFDQSDASNWYHPIGFAYEPDGAHGSTWGGAELPEVEGKGELQYFIDGKKPTCADAGDTGLDCYEPEFFLPRGDWSAKKYTAKLKITQAVADASFGGEIYYFCHIHSKMSGKIKIKGSSGKAGSTAKALYLPSPISSEDLACGTFGVGVYGGGNAKACTQRFLCGTFDTNFERCLQAIDCAMSKEMKKETQYDGSTTSGSSRMIATFMQQMIPHHQNAVNMAKLVMKQVPAATITAAMDEDAMIAILWNIINVQNYQIHQFRNYLEPKKLLMESDIADTKTEWRPSFQGGSTIAAVILGSLGPALLFAIVAAIYMSFCMKKSDATTVTKAASGSSSGPSKPQA